MIKNPATSTHAPMTQLLATSIFEAPQFKVDVSSRPSVWWKTSFASSSSLSRTHGVNSIDGVERDFQGKVVHFQDSLGQFFVVAVLDGHGPCASEVAKLAAVELRRLLADEHGYSVKADAKSRCNALKSTIVDVHKHVCQHTASEESGTAITCLVVHPNEYSCIIASCGDARAIICRREADGEYEAIALADGHTVTAARERLRLETSGAVIQRSVEASPIDQPALQIVLNGLAHSSLTASRCLGNRVAQELGVVAKPSCSFYRFHAADQFVVVGSAPLWHALSPTQVCDFVLKHSEDEAMPVDCASLLTLEAQQRWESHLTFGHNKDVSAVVVRLPVAAPSNVARQFVSTEIDPNPADIVTNRLGCGHVGQVFRDQLVTSGVMGPTRPFAVCPAMLLPSVLASDGSETKDQTSPDSVESDHWAVRDSHKPHSMLMYKVRPIGSAESPSRPGGLGSCRSFSSMRSMEFAGSGLFDHEATPHSASMHSSSAASTTDGVVVASPVRARPRNTIPGAMQVNSAPASHELADEVSAFALALGSGSGSAGGWPSFSGTASASAMAGGAAMARAVPGLHQGLWVSPFADAPAPMRTPRESLTSIENLSPSPGTGQLGSSSSNDLTRADMADVRVRGGSRAAGGARRVTIADCDIERLDRLYADRPEPRVRGGRLRRPASSPMLHLALAAGSASNPNSPQRAGSLPPSRTLQFSLSAPQSRGLGADDDGDGLLATVEGAVHGGRRKYSGSLATQGSFLSTMSSESDLSLLQAGLASALAAGKSGQAQLGVVVPPSRPSWPGSDPSPASRESSHGPGHGLGRDLGFGREASGGLSAALLQGLVSRLIVNIAPLMSPGSARDSAAAELASEPEAGRSFGDLDGVACSAPAQLELATSVSQSSSSSEGDSARGPSTVVGFYSDEGHGVYKTLALQARGSGGAGHEHHLHGGGPEYGHGTAQAVDHVPESSEPRPMASTARTFAAEAFEFTAARQEAASSVASSVDVHFFYHPCRVLPVLPEQSECGDSPVAAGSTTDSARFLGGVQEAEAHAEMNPGELRCQSEMSMASDLSLHSWSSQDRKCSTTAFAASRAGSSAAQYF